MARINWGRVVVGGLLWFVVFNVLWIVALILYLGPEVQAAFRALGVQYRPTPAFALVWFVLTFVGGVIGVWLYASVRPRYGPGPKTAAIVGVAFWLIGNFIPMMFFGAMGLFSAQFVAIDTVTALVAMVLATLAGAWLYWEA